jgi:hypothetical protein
LKNFREFCLKLKDKCGQMRIDYHLLRTDEPVERALGVYLTRRQRRT